MANCKLQTANCFGFLARLYLAVRSGGARFAIITGCSHIDTRFSVTKLES